MRLYHSLSSWIAIFGVLILLVPTVSSQWAEPGCLNRKSWNITNSSNLDNEAISLYHDLGNDTLRIYLSDDSVEKSYWSENDSLTWITNTGDNNGYLYYNCSGATESDGKTTFPILFDHFTAQNLTIWDEGLNVGYDNSYVYIRGNNGWSTYYINSDSEFGLGTRIRFRGIINNATAVEGVTHSNIGYDNHDGSGSGDYVRFQTSDDDQTKGNNHDVGDSTTTDYGIQTTERTYDIRRINSSHTGYFANGEEKVLTTEVSSDIISVGSEVYFGYSRIDWLFVHNDTDAVVSVSFGSEESTDTNPPNIDFVSPTSSNGSSTNGADYIEINASSDKELSECVFQIDYHNYSMSVNGNSCELNFTHLGYVGDTSINLSTILFKSTDNPLVAGQSNEMSPFFENGIMKTMWTDHSTGFFYGNSTTGDDPWTVSGSAVQTPNATNNESALFFPYEYFCTRPECEHKYYLFYAVEGPGDAYQPYIHLRWSDDYYAHEDNWYHCEEELITNSLGGSYMSITVNNPAVTFNGTTWLMLIEGNDGNPSTGLWIHEGTNPCAIWTELSSSPVMDAGHHTGAEGGTGNDWVDWYGDRLIGIIGSKDGSSNWRPYLLNSTDGFIWNQIDTSAFLQLGPGGSYDDRQTADGYFAHAPNEFNESQYFYGAVDGSIGKIALASTSYPANQLWGAGIQDIGYMEFTVYASDDSGNWNSTTRTLLFEIAEEVVENVTLVVEIVSPANQTYNISEGDSEINISLNVTANGTVSEWRYSLNNATNQTFSPNTTLVNLTEGFYHLVVWAESNQSEWFNDEVYFTLQNETVIERVQYCPPDIVSMCEPFEQWTSLECLSDDTLRKTKNCLIQWEDNETLYECNWVKTEDETCDYGCSSEDNRCKFDPIMESLIIIALIFLVFFFARWVWVKKPGGRRK